MCQQPKLVKPPAGITDERGNYDVLKIDRYGTGQKLISNWAAEGWLDFGNAVGPKALGGTVIRLPGW
jgi:hypothetical protein